MSGAVVIRLMVAVMISLQSAPIVAFAGPGLTENDAGTGGDAADARALALPVGEGTYHGNLTFLLDSADWYTFLPPHGSVIRLTVTSEWVVDATLVSPDERVRRWASAGEGRRVERSAIADPPGPWRFVIDGADSDSPRVSYSFSLEFEAHDHVATFVAPSAPGVAFHAAIPKGSFARLELQLHPTPKSSSAAGASAFIDHLRFTDARGAVYRSDSVIIQGGRDETLVRVQGIPPADVTLSTPEFDAIGDPLEFYGAYLFLEDPRGGTSLGYGIASQHGIRAIARIAWDGPSFPMGFLPGTQTFFAPLSAFEGDGGSSLHVAGTYGFARNVSASYSAPPNGTTLVAANALPSPGAMKGGPLLQVLQDGVEVDTLERTSEFWSARRDNSGHWRFRMIQADGNEGGVARALAATFPFPKLAS
jgi:hypothetical protein